MAVVIIYTLLWGAAASVVRGAIVCSLALIGGRLGRRGWGLNTLAAATRGIWLYADRLQAGLEA